ncbi:GFA family protein [Roseovarius faecimaris]|uniref:GFA family protein n=1 Tax=Roseovarius faecimaris TaxID=2494550 RepID=A0A6I6IS06_9RHOB|nr:GFA family protein [Roseovarius faecimaris]QGX99535.1 GFA family protein [Roseovarius faecimaris]
MLEGSCLCGAVTFRVDATPEGAVACHCGQCRKQSGHVWALASVPKDRMEIKGAVSWYAASPVGERGFCPTCGSFLFWRGHDEPSIEFALGAIDGPTGVRLEGHIWTAFKGDYYEIADGLPQYEEAMP